MLRFWLDRGVDGFRVDVAHGMVKAAGLPDVGDHDAAGLLDADGQLPYFDQDGVHDIYRALARDPRRVPGRADGGGRGLGADAGRLGPLHRARTSCTRRSTSTSSTPPGTPPALRAGHRRVLAGAPSVGAPTTWVLSNHDNSATSPA